MQCKIKISKALVASMFSIAAFLPMWSAYAQNSAFQPMSVIRQAVLDSEFTYVDHGLLFGFNSLESCVWISERIVAVQHYCFPAGSYVARSLALWSLDFGVVEFYEEDLGSVSKRDITLEEFPASLNGFLPNDLSFVRASTISSLREKFYNQENPACWVTNYDWYTNGAPAVGCYLFSAANIPSEWKAEAQNLTGNAAAWNMFYEEILAKLR